MSKKTKYMQIKEELLKEIESGKFKPGDLFYTENELKEKFNVSSITVLRAVQELVQERYLTRIQGKGTFVRKETPKREVKFTEFLHSQNGKTQKNVRNGEEETVVLSVMEIVDENIAKQLEVEPKDKIVHFKRVRKVGNVPWSLQNNYIPRKYIQDLDLTLTDSFISVATLIKEKYDVDLINSKMQETISVQYPAPKFVQYILSLKEGEPVYVFRRKTFVKNEKPYEYVETFVRWDYYSIEISQ